MSASKTTFIFVPGAWHKAEVFTPVASILEAAGYRTDLVDLPSVGPPEHLRSFDPDVAVIRQRVEAAVAAGQRVVLVGHSYGGIPACEALRDIPLATSTGSAVAGGHVAHLFLCASFIIPAQASLISAFGGEPLPWFRITPDQLEVLPATPEQIFYNDLPAEVAAAAVTKLLPQSYQVMHSKLTYEAWRHVPCTYQYCTLDNAIPLAVQEMMVQQTAAGVDVRTESIEAGHSPFVGRPQETAAMLQRAAEL